MKDTLKSVGSFILGICVFVGVIFVGMMFVKGGLWLSERVYPWLVVITAVALLVIILVFLPLAIFRRTRAFAGGGIYIASFVFGLTLWVWSLLTSYTLWGIGGVLVGLFLGGVGVVPVAILASLFHGLWSMVGELLLVTATTFGTRFFGIYLITKTEESGVAGCDVFGAASESYSAADDAIRSYTTRANHCHHILIARHDLYKTCDADAYDETVAAYTDPADFAQYTEAELDAHTAVMENLTAAFDTFCAAAAAFKPANDDLYASAADLHKVYCDTYTFAANAYSNAAHCAMTTALEGNLQAAKDKFQITLLEARAVHAAATDAATARAKAVAFKTKSADDANKAEQLGQKARIAETKAELFLSKAKAAEAIAQTALEATVVLSERTKYRSQQQEHLLSTGQDGDAEMKKMQGELDRLRHDMELLEDPETICSFGQMAFDGDGVEQDYVQAANWYKIAAEKGHTRSQHNLALMYEQGLGVPRDTSLAAKYYRMATEQGHAGSQNNLGTLYESGDGVPKDKTVALNLYRTAADGGDPNAASNMHRLEAIMAGQRT